MAAQTCQTQLALDLPPSQNFRREDFLPSPSNAAALRLVDAWPDWRDRALLLLGPSGAGKSHLCAIFAERARAMAACGRAPPSLAQLVEARPAAIALDDVDLAEDDAALFHLLNYAREHDAYVLMTARRAPWLRPDGLPDFLSRVRRAPVVEIGAPDDALLRAVLEKLFRDRQLVVDAAVLDYGVTRLERSLDAARAFVALVDRESLALARRVTRPLVAKVIERLSLDGASES